MRKVIVDFVAHRSVVVALNDEDDDDLAIELAQEYANYNNPYSPTWDYEGCDATDNDGEINADNIVECEKCGKKYVDHESSNVCPLCGHLNYF